MAVKRNEESDELDYDDFDEEEIDDYEDDETDDDLDDDFDDDPIYRKVFEKAKADAEQAVVEALASEDTNSPVYKGLQKKMSAKDRALQQQAQELQELRAALGMVFNEVGSNSSKSQQTSKEFEAMKAIMEDMLEDDASKQIFRNRMQQANKDSEMDSLKQQIANLGQALQQRSAPPQNGRGNDNEPDEIKQYKTQFQENLEQLAEEAGVDPKDKRLNYGDWNESFLERTMSLNKSIKEIKASNDDETINRARKKVRTPSGPTERGSKGTSEQRGRSLLDIGSQQLAKKMRKVAFS